MEPKKRTLVQALLIAAIIAGIVLTRMPGQQPTQPEATVAAMAE